MKNAHAASLAVSLHSVAMSVLAVGLASGAALGQQITINTVTVGNAGNAADTRVMTDGTSGYGSVGYVYNIGATEVTNAQYTAFLNAKAATDAYGLYNPWMSSAFGGITRTGSAGSYSYGTVSGRENDPVNFVSFWDATRFANWLHNGQGNGDTEDGAYTLTPSAIANNTVTRNAGWQWAITSENEWYKAAYYQPASQGGPAGDYWLYPTSSDTISSAQANFNSPYGFLVAVGSYAPNFYGAFDMAGNAYEWNESVGLYYPDTRTLRGGAFNNNSFELGADVRNRYSAMGEESNYGFRVSQVPAPASGLLVALGALGSRRRSRAGR